jgi:hypothetical protein
METSSQASFSDQKINESFDLKLLFKYNGHQQIKTAFINKLIAG